MQGDERNRKGREEKERFVIEEKKEVEMSEQFHTGSEGNEQEGIRMVITLFVLCQLLYTCRVTVLSFEMIINLVYFSAINSSCSLRSRQFMAPESQKEICSH